ncbi:AAC(3) family N-acetyltransferase [Amycolatopsis sp. CA-128772]|uniref:AAC(3) family N-acetyltransferase n=1 Tax=Amycolatopsis sp. CA-128772 TaxID=2073159 RepID=UPI000CD0D902|nr:AAC(3) family N-acetyltransferase [Amycolatopsis sp. CA-128772]
MILTEQLTNAVDELAPPDRPVMVHASLRSFGAPIEGGADALLDALLAGNRTVLVPSFTEPQFGVAPPAGLRPARNGVDYAGFPATPVPGNGPRYTADCGLVNPGLGVLPAAVIGRPGAVRGTHPLNSFAALGPLADELIPARGPSDVYGPICELAARGGLILLIGVGLDRMTALHLAEQQSGRRLFLRWARGADDRVAMVEVGSCSEGFPRLEPALRAHARTAVVGESRWRAFPARPTLATATATIRADQEITGCADRGCLLCRDSIAGGPIPSG